MRFRRDALESLERANSFYCLTGRWSCRGWVLLPRVDYDKLNKYSTALQLNIGDTRAADNVKALKNVSVVQARCVTRGLASDEGAVYLIEITDGRGVLHNEWFQFPTTSSYNIRAPAYPQTFHPGSMNGGTTWTWTTMIQDLWTQMAAFLGTFPGLPNTPNSTPEGFWFPGVPAWTALCDVLDHVGMTVACDMTKEGTGRYTIVASGAADSTFVALHTKYVNQGRLEDDLEWIDVGAARVPKTVKVLFRRRNSVYGTEETVTYRSDVMAKQWNMAPFYTVSVAAPATFASAVGTHLIWSDFTVRYSDSSDPLDADITTATAIAGELVRQYFDRIYSRTDGFMSRTYAGALPFVTGSQVDGVCYYQDYRGGDRQGWRTHVVRGMCPPWPEIYGGHPR